VGEILKAFIAAGALLSLAPPAAAREPRGAKLVVGQRGEPRSFNPVVEIDEPTRIVNSLLHSTLARTDPVSRRLEPALAESWKKSGDGRRILVRLKPGLRFSDGRPLTAADVAFSFEVFQDEKIAAPQREVLVLNGKSVSVRMLDDRSVALDLAFPTALGERMLEAIPILPRHRLEEPFRQGRLRQVWGNNASPSEVAGAGPFQIGRIEPGRRLALMRNPNYWRRGKDGRALPYLDEIEFVFAPSEDSLVARLLGGEIDLVAGLGSGSFASLKKAGNAQHLSPLDLGPSLDYTFLLFNLNRSSPAAGQLKRRLEWFSDARFRRALSLTVDREAIVRLVYRGHATALWGHVTPARGPWFDPSLPRPAPSLTKARRLLRDAGYGWDGGGNLVDRSGAPVEFTIAASSSNPAYTQTAAILQEDFKKLGIGARTVSLEFRSLLDRVTVKKDYDLAVMALRPGEPDPAADMNVLLSSGKAHLWNLGGPPHDWEIEVDDLMRRQLTATDGRKRVELFHKVQQILASQAPIVSLASPNVLIAGPRGLAGVVAIAGGHPALSNADSLYWVRNDAGASDRSER